jgi:hypothetical protein
VTRCGAGRRRRFLLGPLVALALLGEGRAPPSGPRGAAPAPMARTVAPMASGEPAARRALLLALDAERVYLVDNLVYAAAAGDELAALREIEPQVAWGSQVIVEVPARPGEGSVVVVLRAPLPSGGSLCLAEVGEEEDAGLYYARVGPGAPCPPRAPGMPGWRTDEATGWGEG